MTDCSIVDAQLTLLTGVDGRPSKEGRRRHGELAGVPPGDTERGAFAGLSCLGGLRSRKRGGEPHGV